MSKRHRIHRYSLTVASATLMFASTMPAAEWSAELSYEARIFPQTESDPRQFSDFNNSISALVEFYHEFGDTDQSLTITPYGRADQHDEERTHADLRELLWQGAAGDWEWKAGVGKVFWGVTESQHLVDIINQTDFVENTDGEDKLGQPMINLARVSPWGTFEAFLLPYFRERTFADEEGRLRFALPVDVDAAQYESSAEEYHLDWALRWSHYVGALDLGLSYFSGTGRDPSFLPQVVGGQPVALIPLYEQIEQAGLDAQWTSGGWLWKLEAITRRGQGDRFWAATAGFEYTFVGILETVSDLGLVAEYLYDDRDPSLASPFDDDLFAGFRWTANDMQSTELLAGAIVDASSTAVLTTVEGSRRLGDNWTLELEVRTFAGVPNDDPLYGLRNDDVVQLAITRYF